MRGLILKDLFNLKKEAKSYFLVFAAYFAISIINKDTSILSVLICMLFTILPIGAFTCDEKVGWDMYALTTSANRNDIVISKYILGILSSIVGVLMTLLFSFFRTGISAESMILPVVFWSLSIIFLSILFPIAFKLGVERARIFFTIITVIPAALVIVIGKKGIGYISPDLIDFIFKFGPILAVCIALITITISIFISLAIYNKKDL